MALQFFARPRIKLAVLWANERLTTDGFFERHQGDGTYSAIACRPGQRKLPRKPLRENIARLVRKASVLGVSSDELNSRLSKRCESQSQQHY